MSENGLEILKQRVRAGMARVEELTEQKRARARLMPLDVEEVKRVVYDAAIAFKIEGEQLPRGYVARTNTRNKTGWILCQYRTELPTGALTGGGVVEPSQLALDVATGWLDELADHLQGLMNTPQEDES